MNSGSVPSSASSRSGRAAASRMSDPGAGAGHAAGPGPVDDQVAGSAGQPRGDLPAALDGVRRLVRVVAGQVVAEQVLARQ